MQSAAFVDCTAFPQCVSAVPTTAAWSPKTRPASFVPASPPDEAPASLPLAFPSVEGPASGARGTIDASPPVEPPLADPLPLQPRALKTAIENPERTPGRNRRSES